MQLPGAVIDGAFRAHHPALPFGAGCQLGTYLDLRAVDEFLVAEPVVFRQVDKGQVAIAQRQAYFDQVNGIDFRQRRVLVDYLSLVHQLGQHAAGIRRHDIGALQFQAGLVQRRFRRDYPGFGRQQLRLAQYQGRRFAPVAETVPVFQGLGGPRLLLGQRLLCIQQGRFGNLYIGEIITLVDVEQYFSFLEETAVSQAVVDGGDLAEDLRYQRALRARLHRAVALQVYLVRLPRQLHHVHAELRSRGRFLPVRLRRVAQHQPGQADEYGKNDDWR